MKGNSLRVMYKCDHFNMQLACKLKILSSKEEILSLAKSSGISNEIILSFWLSTQKLVLVLKSLLPFGYKRNTNTISMIFLFL